MLGPFTLDPSASRFSECDLRSEEEKAVDDENNLKIEINTFVWGHAPGDMRLDKADELACKIFELFLEARQGKAVS
jgi:hypothetical protein